MKGNNPDQSQYKLDQVLLRIRLIPTNRYDLRGFLHCTNDKLSPTLNEGTLEWEIESNKFSFKNVRFHLAKRSPSLFKPVTPIMERRLSRSQSGALQIRYNTIRASLLKWAALASRIDVPRKECLLISWSVEPHEIEPDKTLLSLLFNYTSGDWLELVGEFDRDGVVSNKMAYDKNWETANISSLEELVSKDWNKLWDEQLQIWQDCLKQDASLFAKSR